MAAPLNGMMQLAAKHIITAPVMINAIKGSFILYPHCSAAFFIDLLWPSLIGLVVLGLTEYTTIGEAFASALSTVILYPHCSAALIAKDQIINTKAIPAPNTVPITIVKNKVTVDRLKSLKATKQQKIGCGIMITYFVVMMSSAFLPKGFPPISSRIGVKNGMNIAPSTRLCVNCQQ